MMPPLCGNSEEPSHEPGRHTIAFTTYRGGSVECGPRRDRLLTKEPRNDAPRRRNLDEAGAHPTDGWLTEPFPGRRPCGTLAPCQFCSACTVLTTRGSCSSSAPASRRYPRR